jgi:hypothetical protein
MPDLRDAYLRVKRAEEHFEELKRLTREAENAQTQTVRFQANPEGPVNTSDPNDQRPWVRMHSDTAPIPDRCSVLAGDVANDLRASLDYLVARLAELDSGAEQDGTQFPIEDAPQGFKRRKKKFLRGLTDAHVAAIERLQPYKGVNWTKQLRGFSNVDKHRKLHIVANFLTADVAINPAPVGAADPGPGLTRMQMDMRVRAVLNIVLDGHWPLVETMEKIRFHVVETLEAFKPEFEGREAPGHSTPPET